MILISIFSFAGIEMLLPPIFSQHRVLHCYLILSVWILLMIAGKETFLPLFGKQYILQRYFSLPSSPRKYAICIKNVHAINMVVKFLKAIFVNKN